MNADIEILRKRAFKGDILKVKHNYMEKFYMIIEVPPETYGGKKTYRLVNYKSGELIPTFIGKSESECVDFIDKLGYEILCIMSH